MFEQEDDTHNAGSGRQHEKAIGAPGVLIDGIPVQQFFLYGKENKSPEKIIQKIKVTVDDAVLFAEESPYPDVSELYKDVYMQEDYPFIIED